MNRGGMTAMNLERYLDITPEIARAVSENRPVGAI